MTSPLRTPPRRPHGTAAFAFLTAVLLCGSACSGARVQRLETDLQALRDEIDELKRSQAAGRVQADELRNRLVMAEEKADSARVDRARSHSGWIPTLPTVRVGPDRSASAGENGGDVDRARAERARPDRASANAGRTVTIPADPGAPEEEEEDELPASAAAVAPPRSSPSGPGADLPPQLDSSKPKSDAAVVLYNQAKALLDSEQLAVARSLFEKLRDGHPDHDLADNALYWIGESWYAQAQWLQAAQTFLRVAKEYPRGNKVPDAMYKLAKSYERMGDEAGAVEVLKQLGKHYPGTPAAKKASEDLARLVTKVAP